MTMLPDQKPKELTFISTLQFSNIVLKHIAKSIHVISGYIEIVIDYKF
jgi:hypothetical protein